MDATKLSAEKEALIERNLAFWLGTSVKDPDYVLKRIALETKSSDEEVWAVYCKMLDKVFGG